MPEWVSALPAVQIELFSAQFFFIFILAFLRGTSPGAGALCSLIFCCHSLPFFSVYLLIYIGSDEWLGAPASDNAVYVPEGAMQYARAVIKEWLTVVVDRRNEARSIGHPFERLEIT